MWSLENGVVLPAKGMVPGSSGRRTPGAAK